MGLEGTYLEERSLGAGRNLFGREKPWGWKKLIWKREALGQEGRYFLVGGAYSSDVTEGRLVGGGLEDIMVVGSYFYLVQCKETLKKDQPNKLKHERRGSGLCEGFISVY